VVEARGHTADTAEGDEEGAEGEPHVVPVAMEGGAEDAQSNWVGDEHGKLKRVQPVLGVPLAAVAGADVQRKSAVDEVAVDLRNQHREPLDEGESSVACGGPAVAAGSEWRLEEDAEEGGDGDGLGEVAHKGETDE
jgi:hypothetical protein